MDVFHVFNVYVTGRFINKSWIKNQKSKLIKIQKIEIENIKEKLRDELRNAISKENYLSPDDAKLINEFINKLKKELSN